MEKLSLFLLAGLLAFAYWGCHNEKTADGETVQQDDMGQFADDQQFKNAHPKPDTIVLQSQGKMIYFPTPDGGEGGAYALLPEGETYEYLLVIHEWWGLNEHVKQEAQRLFDELGNVAVLALDMYDGQVTDNPDKAAEFMQAISQERAEAIVQGALDYAGPEAEIATIGWCFGGGWALRSAIMAGEQGIACVIYYGLPVRNAEELAPLEADVLGIFADNDGWITPQLVADFESLAAATGKDVEIQHFDADHAFANPSNPKYDAEAAQRANALALDFLKDRL